MSEPKLISPLLDNFIIGDPISDHNGVRCCPAMKKDSDDKYIVKIISVPASPTQLEALLLSGAYSTQEAALAYFNSIAKGITAEADILKELSDIEGFLQLEDYQIEPIADGSGYDVYLLSTYRTTLQRQLRRGNLTHLGALNLGLDLCAALAVSRRKGYLYADLKPANIYVNDSQGYRIGDIGFLPLNSLKYTSLPDRYRSAYTAPEITDAYSDLNTTIDIYALGLILYQIFNDGQLPFKGDAAPGEVFPAPAYADYEMAEIILKACAPDPALRWEDPIAFGQALVGYMQRNGAHDTPIIPQATAEAEVSDSDSSATEENGAFERDENCDVEQSAGETELLAEENNQTASKDINEAVEEITESSIFSEDEEGNLTFLEDETDETANAQDVSDIDYEEVTGEVSDMLLQADELIAHDAPAPVIQPEAIDVPIPPLVDVTEETEEDNGLTQNEQNASECEHLEFVEEEIETEEITEIDGSTEHESESVEPIPEDDEVDEVDSESDAEFDDGTPAKKRIGKIIGKIIFVLLAAALLMTGYIFYTKFYLQTVDAIALEPGGIGELAVKVHSQIDDSKLKVICTDTYGIQHVSDVANGIAFFDDLAPDTAYTIKVDIDGFHKLTGDTTAAYTTPEHTEIIQFAAVTGSTDGSVILSFVVDGSEPDEWKVLYVNDQGAEESLTFTGKIVTISDLTVGKEYTFTLTPVSDLEITGTNTLTHTASAIVRPENLVVTECTGDKLTAKWSAPLNIQVTGWTVRCYNDNFDETIVVTESSATFTIPDSKASYTVEVTASGMSVSERVFVSENSITVTGFTINNTKSNTLDISWSTPEGVNANDWSMQYTIDRSAPKTLTVTDNSVSVPDLIPGCEYRFVLQTADGQAVLGGTHSYMTAEAPKFSGYRVSASDMEFKMCRTPSNKNWDRYDLSDSDYTNEFTSGEKASFLVRLKRAYDTSSNKIETLFVIRDESGAIVSTATTTQTWTRMWYKNYCELDIPSLPQTAGKYTITVFFNDAYAGESVFTITE